MELEVLVLGKELQKLLLQVEMVIQSRVIVFYNNNSYNNTTTTNNNNNNNNDNNNKTILFNFKNMYIIYRNILK